MATVTAASLPNSFWSKRIRIDFPDGFDIMDVFTELKGYIEPALAPILARGFEFKLKVEMMSLVDIEAQGKYDSEFWLDIVPFEVGVARHGMDGSGGINLDNLIGNLRERVENHLNVQGKHGSDIVFKGVKFKNFYIVPTAATRRLQPRRLTAGVP